MNDGLLRSRDLALSTDLYELTMAAAFERAGFASRTATFDVAVRSLPHDRGYLVAAGLEQALAYLRDLRFDEDALEFLAGSGHFSRDFIDGLADFRFTGSVDAVPEGTVVFPPAPLLRVTGPIIEAQIVETYLLTTLTYQTMIASKAARIVGAARGRAVVDFSARRDHGPQAGLLCARAAYLGGCVGTSNVAASRAFDIPAIGTMAHSYVMFHEDEVEAFRSFADSYPGDPTLLIDTYDTVRGARRALELLPQLRKQGRELGGVRLDSGDLVQLSRQVREVLRDGGASEARIWASGNLDEYKIEMLLGQGAEIDGFGVGTELGTSGDAPSLNSTYKLVSCVDARGEEHPVIKLSTGKISLPGRKQVWRRYEDGRAIGDTIALAQERLEAEPLLTPVMRDGEVIDSPPALDAIRSRAAEQLDALPDEVKRLERPAPYPVTLSAQLRDLVETLRTHQKAGS
jgi:nicotinate phosphoribosyltransferase